MRQNIKNIVVFFGIMIEACRWVGERQRVERRQLCGGVNLRGVLDQSKYDCSAMDHMMLIPAACVCVWGLVSSWTGSYWMGWLARLLAELFIRICGDNSSGTRNRFPADVFFFIYHILV